MPYIKKELRQKFDPALATIWYALRHQKDCGPELNYCISRLVKDIFLVHPSYARIQMVMGVLSCAQAEFYRRYAAPYEDQKIKENGDVP